jgi:hypothetical protein
MKLRITVRVASSLVDVHLASGSGGASPVAAAVAAAWWSAATSASWRARGRQKDQSTWLSSHASVPVTGEMGEIVSPVVNRHPEAERRGRGRWRRGGLAYVDLVAKGRGDVAE